MRRWQVFLIGVVVLTLFYPTLRITFTGLKVIYLGKNTLKTAQNYLPRFFDKNPQQAQQFKTNLAQLNQALPKFNQQAHQSKIFNHFFKDRLDQIEVATDLSAALQRIISGNQTYVFLFQNSEEIRATGGFLGSYAKIRLSDGVLKDFKIEDIYVPDGQFDWFIEAPTGAREYLSGGQGLKLRDANWHPDFPTSAQQILTYLAWGKEAGLNGVVGVNLQIVEDVLAVTGPVYLHDYDQVINQNNFADAARANRKEFFPGSIQKQHFLNTFFNQLIITLKNLGPEQQQQLVEKLIDNSLNKNLQFYSNDSEIQATLNKLGISGELNLNQADSYLMLVESNVGINKANQHLERAVEITTNESQTLLEVTFVNHNFPPLSKKQSPDEANHLGYVNYQRLILPIQTEIKEIIFNEEIISTWDEEIINNSNQQKFKQVGFLITVPERETKKLVIKLDNLMTQDSKNIWLQKQSGVEKVPYYLNFYGQESSFELTKDTLVNLNN